MKTLSKKYDVKKGVGMEVKMMQVKEVIIIFFILQLI